MDISLAPPSLAVPRAARVRTVGDVRLRACRAGEVGTALDLLHAIFPGDATLPDEAEFRATVTRGTRYASVLEADGAVAGCFFLRDQPFRPWTNGAFFGIAVGHRGRGLGDILMGEALAVARRPLFRLLVRESNLAARRIYEAHGCQVVSRRRANYENGEDALVMMRWNGVRLG